MNTNNSRGLVLLGGPSGVGKKTIYNLLLALYPNHFSALPRITTRRPRPYEIYGVDYHYVTLATFEGLKDSDKLIAPHEFKGQWYGVERDLLETALKSKNNRHTLCAAGFCSMEIRIAYGGTFIYLTAPVEELESRLMTLGDTPEDIHYKLTWAETEWSMVSPYITDLIANRTGKFVETISRICSILSLPFARQSAPQLYSIPALAS